MTTRQQVLQLYLGNSSLAGAVVGWAFHDGAAGRGPELPSVDAGAPPYATGVAALEDGWRLIQMSPLLDPVEGSERRSSFLRYEFLFERLTEI